MRKQWYEGGETLDVIWQWHRTRGMEDRMCCICENYGETSRGRREKNRRLQMYKNRQWRMINMEKMLEWREIRARMQRGILSTSLSIQAERRMYDYKTRVNGEWEDEHWEKNGRESMKAEDWYIDIFIAKKLWMEWGMCDWELSVDDLCDMWYELHGWTGPME